MRLSLQQLRGTRNYAQLASGAQAPVIGQQIIYWPGPGAPNSYQFAPRLRSQATLKALGWNEADYRALWPRADSRPTVAANMRRAVNAAVHFNAAGDGLAVPGVYVPTSLANGYGGFTR